MLVKLPTCDSTLPNRSGICQATVNEQMPPDEMPQIARLAESFRKWYFLATSGRISSLRKRAYWSDIESYSKLRFGAGGLPSCGITPGLMKMPIVTGISCL